MDINNSLGFLLNQSARHMKRYLDAALKQYQVTTSHWAVLVTLYQSDGLSQVALAKLLDSDKATCGSIIDGLVKRGLVTRVLNSDDRRSYQIRLTQKAKQEVSSMTQEAQKCNEIALKGFTTEEENQLKEYLARIIENLGGTANEYDP